jgi:hypothetical protein
MSFFKKLESKMDKLLDINQKSKYVMLGEEEFSMEQDI